MRKGDLIGLVTLLAVVGLIGSLFLFGGEGQQVTGYLPVDFETGSVEIVGPNEEGTELTLRVELEEPGFVSIHESMGNAPAEIIGVSEYIEPGISEVTISISPSFLPGFKYITLLQVDDGSGRFELQEDLPVRVNGEVVRPDFTFRPEDAVVPIPGTDIAIPVSELETE